MPAPPPAAPSPDSPSATRSSQPPQTPPSGLAPSAPPTRPPRPTPSASGSTLPYAVLRDLAGQMAESLGAVPDLQTKSVLVCESADLAGLVAFRRLEADAQRLATCFASCAPATGSDSETGGLESVSIGTAVVLAQQGLDALDGLLALAPRIQPLLNLFKIDRSQHRQRFRFDPLASLAAIAGSLRSRCHSISALPLSGPPATFPSLAQALQARRQTQPPDSGHAALDWQTASAALDRLQQAVAGISGGDPAPAAPTSSSDATPPLPGEPPTAPARPGQPSASETALELAESLRRGAQLSAALVAGKHCLVLEPLAVELLQDEQHAWWRGTSITQHCRLACAMLLFDPHGNVLAADIYEGHQNRSLAPSLPSVRPK